MQNFVLALFLTLSLSFSAVAETQSKRKLVASAKLPEATAPFELAQAVTKAVEPKERSFAFGLDIGGGLFTGGLGNTVSPGAAGGITVDAYVAKGFAIELGVHYGNNLDSIFSGGSAAAPSNSASIDTTMIPITLGVRYDFLAQSPVNVYVLGGGGMYIRRLEIVDGTQVGVYKTSMSSSGSTNSLGFYGGAGVEFFPGGRSFSFAIDVRYHLISFSDADDTFNNTLPSGARSGGYVTPSLSLRLSM